MKGELLELMQVRKKFTFPKKNSPWYDGYVVGLVRRSRRFGGFGTRRLQKKIPENL